MTIGHFSFARLHVVRGATWHVVCSQERNEPLQYIAMRALPSPPAHLQQRRTELCGCANADPTQRVRSSCVRLAAAQRMRACVCVFVCARAHETKLASDGRSSGSYAMKSAARCCLQEQRPSADRAVRYRAVRYRAVPCRAGYQPVRGTMPWDTVPCRGIPVRGALEARAWLLRGLRQIALADFFDGGHRCDGAEAAQISVALCGTHAHARMHTHTQTHTHTHMHARTRTYTHIHIHILKHIHKHSHGHARTHARAHTDRRTYARAYRKCKSHGESSSSAGSGSSASAVFVTTTVVPCAILTDVDTLRHRTLTFHR